MNDFLKPLAVLGACGLLISCGKNETAETEAAVAEADAGTAKSEMVETAAVEETTSPVVTLDTTDKKVSYLIGYQMAARYKEDPILEFDEALLQQGVSDAMAGKDSLVSEEDQQAVSMEMQERHRAQQEEATAEERAAGVAFLEANKSKEGVVVTESGLQYKVITKGDSEEHPVATDTVKVHYHGTLINGDVFDSSVERGEPISFPLNGVIKGWTEGLQLMSIGDKFRFFIPSDLGYGGRATGSIPAHSTLIFDVELLGINEE